MPAHRLIRSALVMASLVAPLGAARADVYTVDDDGPADFSDFFTAMAVVQDGDTLLVKGGVYYSLGIQGVSVSVLAVPGETVHVGFLGVGQLADDQPVYVRGLTVVGDGTNLGVLSAANCRAAVWFDQVEVAPPAIQLVMDPLAVAFPASVFKRCDLVIMTGCTLLGLDAAPFLYGPITAGTALEVEDGSNLVLHQTFVEGGTGTDGYLEGLLFEPLPGDPGARGVEAHDSRLHLAGSTLRGGHGGAGLDGPPCTAGGAAGDGGFLMGATARIERLSSLLLAGSEGAGGSACLAGAEGQAVVLQDGATIEDLPGTARSLSLTPVAAPGEDVTLTLDHGANETWFLVAGPRPQWWDADGILGPLLVEPAVVRALDPFVHAGSSQLTYRAPALPVGMPTLEIYVQGVAFVSGGAPVASTPARLTVIDLASHLP